MANLSYGVVLYDAKLEFNVLNPQFLTDGKVAWVC